MTIDDIARAYHCPYQTAVRIYHGETSVYRLIYRLGPMRIWWRKGRGWALDNKPTDFVKLMDKFALKSRRA